MNHIKNRRHFLGMTASAAGSLLVPRSIVAAKSAGFSIGACDWTLRKATNPESMVLAKRIGLDGVEVDLGRPAEGVEKLPLADKTLQDAILRESKTQGVAIPSLAMGVLNSVPLKSSELAEQWVYQSVDIATAMKVKLVLLAFFGKGDLRNDDEGKARTIERLRKLAPKAEAAGVVYGIESYLTADELIEIVDAVGSKNIRVYYDLGNMHKVGEDIYSAITKLGTKYICQFHAKDLDGLYGKGSIDFPKARQAMDEINYRGWIMMEGTVMSLGVEESNRADCNYLRTVFPKSLKKT